MKGMTTQERIDEICSICGLSEDIVRRVMDAERQSITNSLRRGERANLIGRVIIHPELKGRIAIGGTLEHSIKLNIKPSAALEASLADLNGFESAVDEDDDGIMLNQIHALT